MKTPNRRIGTGRPEKNFRVGLSRKEIESVISSCAQNLELPLRSAPLEVARRWRQERKNYVADFRARRKRFTNPATDAAEDRSMAKRSRAARDLDCGLIERLESLLAVRGRARPAEKPKGIR